ncbi:sulfatase family protein [Dinghuibacter silviterrae]|nr:sulfatase [Dinghuibacter silviterrae]
MAVAVGVVDYSYAQGRPNIVLIISDDHAYKAIGVYGNPLGRTPNIDRIAREGVLFTHAYVNNSLCGPSRAAILTGKYSHKNGFTDNEHSRFDGSQESFIKELQKNGYLTAWIGKWHLETKPRGFDFWEILPGQGNYFNPDFILMDSSKKRVDGYASNVIEDVAEQWLDSRDTSRPFCLVVGHKATHRTWMPDTCDLGKYDKVTFPLPHDFYDDYEGRKAAQVQDMTIARTMLMGYDLKMFDTQDAEDKDGSFARMNPAQRARYAAYYQPVQADLAARHLSGHTLTEWKYQHFMRDYMSTALSLDRNIGRMLDYLDRHHLTRNTIVIYLSDQGFYLGEHGWFDKRWIYEESFRTPMVMRYPGVVKPNTRDDRLVMNVDIGPTLLNAAHVAIPADMQGQSFLPLLKDGRRKGRKAIYYHYYENGEHSVSPHFGVRTKRYVLVRFYQKVNAWELYDLARDPNEIHNLYGKTGFERTEARLRKVLVHLLHQYDDQDALKIVNQEP